METEQIEERFKELEKRIDEADNEIETLRADVAEILPQLS